jgi:integrase
MPMRTAKQSPLDYLEVVAADYINAHDLCLRQQANLLRHATSFARWQDEHRNGHSDSAAINAWLASLVTGRAPSTVNDYRTSLLSLVRFASADDDVLPRVDRIRRQKEPDSIKLAFNHAEIRQAIQQASSYRPMTKRTFGQGLAGDEIPRPMWDKQLPWSIWWEAFWRVGYDSGQYLSDLQQLTWSLLRRDGSATIVRHKTGRLISFRLRPKTIWAARRIGGELVIPWRWNLAKTWDREFKRFVQFAGLRNLTAKSLRRSAITYTYIDQGPEAARLLAGHASFATTAKHYIDWSIAKRPAIQPPPL